MSIGTGEKEALARYMQAAKGLRPMLATVQLLGLIKGALRSGLLDAARSPTSPARIAESIGVLGGTPAVPYQPGNTWDQVHA